MDTLQVLIEAFKTRMETHTQIANLYVVYGAIALGLITFSLPLLINNRSIIDPTVYSWAYRPSLLVGILCLIIASGIFFLLSRTITLRNHLYGILLYESSFQEDKIKYIRAEWDKVAYRISPFFSPPPRRCATDKERRDIQFSFLVRWAKGIGAIGLLFYILAVAIFIGSKLFGAPT